MVQLIIFDLDGTLLDSLTDITNSVNYVLTYFNKPTKTKETIQYYLGHGPKYLLEKAFDYDIEDYDHVFKVYDNHYKKHQSDYTKPYDGVKETLAALKEKGFLLAVCSNKQDAITKALMASLFPNTFDYVIGTNSNLERKPSSDMPNHILNKLNIKAGDALYVGDTEIDLKTAKNANLKSVAVTYGFRKRSELVSHKPDYIIDHIEELLKIITVS